MTYTLSVVIPTYANPKFLDNLASNLPYLEACEIIVVNDNPKNPLSLKLKNLPITLLELPKNKGFSGAVNEGIRKAHGSYLLLINDDVILKDRSFTTICTQFENNPDLFAITIAQQEQDGSIRGKNCLFWENGFFRHSSAKDILPGETGWAEGGSSVFDLKKLKKLGGFDERYSPFYWEDIDLSYRAKTQGYRILFDPSVVVTHHHETTISSIYARNKIESIAFGNQLLFTWTHTKEPARRRKHSIALAKFLVRTVLAGNFSYMSGFFQALRKFTHGPITIT